MRIIAIGCREKWDYEALNVIASHVKTMTLRGKEKIAEMIWAHNLDIYDMAKRPRKGDAYEALREKTDTIAVIACHLYGLTEKKPKKYAAVDEFTDEGYRYTKHNHQLLNLCMKRNIPFIVIGDQPIDEDAKMPDNITRHIVRVANRPIYVYERA